MIIFVFYIIILLVCLLLKSFGISYEILSMLYVILTSIVFIFYILKSKFSKKIKLLLFLAFFIRFICALIDLYGFRIPHAGSDDDGFYEESLRLYTGSIQFNNSTYGLYYTLLLNFLYQFIGSNRLGVQFTNVLFSLISIIYIVKIFNELKLSEKTTITGVSLISFMPNLIFLNSILRRDTLITMLIVISIYKILNWYQTGNMKSAILSLIYVGIASIFHTAPIFIAFVYLLFIIMYNRQKEKIDFSGLNFIKVFFLVLCSLGVGGYFLGNLAGSKFSGFTSMDSVYELVSYSYGGSVYLANLNIENFYQLVLYSPLKFIYFLFSPMPWDVRGIADISSFILDSIVYIYLFYLVISNKKNGFSKIMFYSFLVVTLIFSLRTFTSGTALRHRYNVFPLLLVCACYLMDEKKKAKKI